MSENKNEMEKELGGLMEDLMGNEELLSELEDFIDDDFEVVTLMGEDGEEIDFVIIEEVVLHKVTYCIMQPVELPEGMGEDEALVFRKKLLNKKGEMTFELEMDDKVIEQVFDEYNRILDEQLAEEEE